MEEATSQSNTREADAQSNAQVATMQCNTQEATTQLFEESLTKGQSLGKEIVDAQNDKDDLQTQLKKMDEENINQ